MKKIFSFLALVLCLHFVSQGVVPILLKETLKIT